MRRATDVTPVIVIIGARSITMKERPVDVVVVRDSELVPWHQRRSSSFLPQSADAHGEVMSTASLWGHRGSSDPSILPKFSGLKREVEAARRVRIFWALGAIPLMFAALAAAPTVFGIAFDVLAHT